jgi:putative transposase
LNQTLKEFSHVERNTPRGTPKITATVFWQSAPLRSIIADRTIGYSIFTWSRPISQSLVQLYMHIVFSTQGREPFLVDRTIRENVHTRLGGLCNELNCPVIRVGGIADHIHVLCRFGKSITVSDFHKEFKRKSSRWIKTISPDLRNFYWQKGYGAFSVSPAHVDALRRYIDNQEEHHKTESFQDEFRRLLKKYGVEYDERYVWD